TEHPSFPSPHLVSHPSSSLSRRPSPGGQGAEEGAAAAPLTPRRAGQFPLLGAGKWLLSAPGRPATRRERRQGSALGRGASRRPWAGLPPPAAPRAQASPALPPASACPPPPPRPRRP
ncbi:unnamed protein product, partial [Rangifer tarandus platyrhynchus]